ncbi:hypothetical protein PtB15_5B361 [Puccinia triticina]|nr:hypothetical protein PtB15_5B361 [Puccinia triticina]
MVEKSLTTRALSSKRIEAARQEEVATSSTEATAGIHTDITPASQGPGIPKKLYQMSRDPQIHQIYPP